MFYYTECENGEKGKASNFCHGIKIIKGKARRYREA